MEKHNSIFSIKKSINIAKSEYVKWICNPKISLILIMLIFVYDMVINKMIGAAEKMGEALNVFEPFLAICNSSVMLLIIPCVFIGLMGDFPRVDGNSMFYLQRAGKQNWLFGQLLFSVMSAVTYVVIVLTASCLSVINGCALENRWSDVTTRYAKTFPNDAESFVANLIDGRLYNNLEPLEATVLTFILAVILLVLINMLLILGFTMGKHGAGIVVTSAIICIGTASVQFETALRWLFPTAHISLWLHYDKIYKTQVFHIGASFVYLLVSIAVLYFLSSIIIDRYDFSKISDMED